jgi:hypothetical protein
MISQTLLGEGEHVTRRIRGRVVSRERGSAERVALLGGKAIGRETWQDIHLYCCVLWFCCWFAGAEYGAVLDFDYRMLVIVLIGHDAILLDQRPTRINSRLQTHV